MRHIGKVTAPAYARPITDFDGIFGWGPAFWTDLVPGFAGLQERGDLVAKWSNKLVPGSYPDEV